MLFHTWTFFLFFILTLVGFWALRPTRYWLHWILLSSAVFYGWWHPYYLLLVFYSTRAWSDRGGDSPQASWHSSVRLPLDS